MQPTRRGILGLIPLVTSGCAARFGAPPALVSAPLPDGGILMDDGAVLPYRAWLPTRPVGAMLALHGVTDSRDFFAIPAPAFVNAGIAVYAPDQRGFGAGPHRGYWAGGSRMAKDAVACMAWLRERHPGLPIYLAGESMGGAVAVLAAPHCAPSAVALMAPAVWSRALMGPVYRAGLWVGAHVIPNYLATGKDVPIPVLACDNREALREMARDPLTLTHVRLDMLVGLADLMDQAAQAESMIPSPCLWQYGAHDQLVPPKCTLDGWARTRGVRFAYYQHGWHMLLRDQARAVPTGDLIGFFRDPGAPLVSSAEIAAAGWSASAGE